MPEPRLMPPVETTSGWPRRFGGCGDPWRCSGALPPALPVAGGRRWRKETVFQGPASWGAAVSWFVSEVPAEGEARLSVVAAEDTLKRFQEIVEKMTRNGKRFQNSSIFWCERPTTQV